MWDRDFLEKTVEGLFEVEEGESNQNTWVTLSNGSRVLNPAQRSTGTSGMFRVGDTVGRIQPSYDINTKYSSLQMCVCACVCKALFQMESVQFRYICLYECM